MRDDRHDGEPTPPQPPEQGPEKPVLPSLIAALAKQNAAMKALANSSALDSLTKQVAGVKALSGLTATDAARSAVLKALGASTLAERTETPALNSFLNSPALDDARKSLATSGALTAFLASPAAGPSPIAAALAKAAAAPPTAPPTPLPSIPSPPPHRLAPQRARRRVLARVAALGDLLRRRHEGAWDAIHRDGPDSVSQAAGSLVELITGALRESVPAEEVTRWLNAEGRSDYDSHGFPTIRARTEFLLIHGGAPPRTAAKLAEALTGLCSDLQEVKHGRVAVSMDFIASALFIVEAILLASPAPARPAPRS